MQIFLAPSQSLGSSVMLMDTFGLVQLSDWVHGSVQVQYSRETEFVLKLFLQTQYRNSCKLNKAVYLSLCLNNNT